MTKSVTGAATTMLHAEGKPNLAGSAAKHLPEFFGLKTPSGAPATPARTQSRGFAAEPSAPA